MLRRPRIATGGFVYHVLNSRVARLPLFETPADYSAFEQVLEPAVARTGIRLTNSGTGVDFIPPYHICQQTIQLQYVRLPVGGRQSFSQLNP